MAGRDLIPVARETVAAFNAGDPKRYQATLTADVVYDEVGTGRRIKGAKAWGQCWEGWRQAMPDVKGTVTNTIASGETVVLEITWAGTHTGPLVGPGGTIPASGQRQVTRAALVCMFRGKRIKEAHHYFDMMALLQQIGALNR